MPASVIANNNGNAATDDAELYQIGNSLTQKIQQRLSVAVSSVITNEIMLEAANYDVDKFSSWAAGIIAAYEDVDNVQLAPDGIVQFIYPLQGNEKAIGNNLLKDPQRKKAAELAMASGETTVIGPIRLLQNDKLALIARKPLEKNKAFWVFSTALILLDELLADIAQEIDQSRYLYAIYGNHPDKRQPPLLASSQQLPSEDAESFIINVPNGQWLLLIEARQVAGGFWSTAELDYLAKKKVLKIYADKAWAPYNFTEQGRASGYVNDLLHLAFEKLPIDYEFVTGHRWLDYLQMLKQGQIDLVSNMIPTDKRRQFYAFTRQPVLSQVPSVFSFTKINQLEDLNGKRLGDIKGYYSNDILKQRYPQIQLKLFDNTEALLQALLNQQIDAVIEDGAVVKHFLQSKNINLDLHQFILLQQPFSQNLHIAVNVDDQQLANILDKLLVNVDAQKLTNLQNKWQVNLVDTQKASLTMAERLFLQSKESLKVCSRFNHYPLSGAVNDQLTGISGDVFDRLSVKLGVDFSAVAANSDVEFLQNIRNNRCELVAILKQGFDGFDNIKTTDTPVVYEHFVVIASTEHAYLSDIQDYQGYTFYVLKSVHKALLQQQYPDLNIVLLKNEQQIMQSVAENPQSVYVTLSILGDYAIQQYGTREYKVISDIPSIKAIGAIGVNMQTAPQLLPIIDKALAESNSQREKSTTGTSFCDHCS